MNTQLIAETIKNCYIKSIMTNIRLINIYYKNNLKFTCQNRNKNKCDFYILCLQINY